VIPLLKLWNAHNATKKAALNRVSLLATVRSALNAKRKGRVMEKRYLGDGVYAARFGSLLVLTAEDSTHSMPVQEINFELPVLENLLDCISDFTKELKEERKNDTH